jgi:hypothetical protein
MEAYFILTRLHATSNLDKLFGEKLDKCTLPSTSDSHHRNDNIIGADLYQ